MSVRVNSIQPDINNTLAISEERYNENTSLTTSN